MDTIRKYISYLAPGHILASVVWLMFFLYPFIDYWEYNIGSMTFTLRQGKGYLSYNAIIAVALSSFGMLLGGYWWRIMRYLKPQGYLLRWVFLVLMIVIVTYNYISLLEVDDVRRYEPATSWFYAIGAAALTITLVYSWIFFCCVAVTLIINNIIVLNHYDLPLLNYISALLGRVSFHMALVSLLWMTIELMLRSVPKTLRWPIWSIYTCLIVVSIVDIFTHTVMNRPLMTYINSFTETGDFNWRKEFTGAGDELLWVSEMSNFQVVLIITLFFIITGGFAAVCWFISKRKKWFSLKTVCYIFGASFVLLLTEQALGMAWKGKVNREKEWQAFDLKIPFFKPAEGIGEYRIEFVMNAPEDVSKETLRATPDIYFIMVESMRGDTLTPEITPFLHELSITGSQRFHQSWAGSNATHLSWFSVFHSRPSVHWGYTVEEQKGLPKEKGAPTMKWLKANGYNIEVRAVCDQR